MRRRFTRDRDGWKRSQTRHARFGHRERANALAELLAHTLESYRDTLRFHTEAEHADAERCAGFDLPRNDAGDCGSCTTDLHILEEKARDLGVRLREEASR